MKKIISLVFFFAFLLAVVGQTKAAETMVFDSTDNYLGACLLTDKSEWELKEDINVTKFEVWYSWDQGESTLPVKLFLNGEKFAEFEATRSQCDPYQKQWCNADFQINKLFPAGKYSTEIPNKRQCLKPGGTGAIRLFAEDSAVKKEEPAAEATTIVEQKSDQVNPNVVTANQQNSCSCSQTTIILTAVVTSVVSSFLVSFLLRKK
jgi:hypothetical protein